MNTQLYCLPVVKTGTVFREALPDTVSAATELIPLEDLIDYLDSHYAAETGTVFIQGASHQTQVYLPTDDSDDYAYIVVDSNLRPPDAEGDHTTLSEAQRTELSHAIAHQLKTTGAKCAWSESLFATTKLNLLHSFIRPRVARVSIDNFGYPHDAGEQRVYSVEEVAAKPRVVLLGPPGSGKTTFFRYLALYLIELASESEDAAIPVYVQLRHFNPRQGLKKFLPANLEQGHSGAASVRFAWFLDGFDEIRSSESDEAKSEISRLARQKKKDLLFLCARESSYDGFLRSECEHYELLPFDWSQISQWIYQHLRYMPSEPWRVLLHLLGSVLEVMHIARNPLLLSVLTHHFSQSEVVPQQRAELLERFVDTLCEGWDSVRGVSRQEPGSVAPYRRSTILAWTAFEMKRRDTSSVTASDLDRWRANYAPIAHGPEGESLLCDLAETTGLITRSSHAKSWVFIHQVFCDYLAARYLVARTDDVVGLLDELAQSDSWQDVWILACEITHDASHLVRGVLKSEKIDGDMQAILLSGAIAQGVDLDMELSATCRDVILRAFARHASAIESLRLKETPDGSCASLILPASASSAPDQERTKGFDFVRKLLTFLYRARWWRAGRAIVTDLGKAAGTVGSMAASLLLREGTIRGSSDDLQSLDDDAEPEVIIEVDSKLHGE